VDKKYVNDLLERLSRTGLSRKQLAHQLKVNRDTIDTWFTKGSTQALPSPASVKKIIALLSESAEGGSAVRPLSLMPGGSVLEDRQESSGSTPLRIKSEAESVRDKSSAKEDRLRKAIDESILLPYKTITDCIHEDISLTKMEIEIIDTLHFQRLRSFKQLGTAYLTYPCAVHTRFEHSLGTLAQASEIIQRINGNLQRERSISLEEQILIRLAALLHDVSYAPFGHELEDEASVIPKHEYRYEEFLDTSAGGIGGIIKKHLDEDLLRELIAILKSKSEDEVNSLRYPFISDLVKNTVCADLLDYLKRDNYFTGLKESFGRRFMNYFVVTPIPSVTGKKQNLRLAIRLEKKGIPRRDVLSEVVHLLRARYSLGEKVYYHHTKQVTSAMISKAVYLAGYHRDASSLCKQGDEALLISLQNQTASPTAKQMVEELRSRQLYKSVYWIDLEGARYKQPSLVRELHDDFEKRAEVERGIASDCSVNPEDIIIYCPDSDMALKEAAVKVIWLDGTTKELRQVREDPPGGELRELNEKHHALWRFCVLLRSSLVDKKGQELSDACFHRWGVVNRNPLFAKVGPEQSLKTLMEFIEQSDLLGKQMKELQEVAHLDKTGQPRTVEGWRQLWQRIHTSDKVD